MTDYILKGPTIPLQNIHFQKYLLETFRKQDPKKVLLVDVEAAKYITSEELQEKYIKLAHGLRSYIKKGDTLALVCENTWLSILPVLASLHLGSTIGVVNPAYLAYQLKQNFIWYKPKVVFCSEIALENVLKAKEELDFIEVIVTLSTKNTNGIICIQNFIENNCKGVGGKNVEPTLVEDINQTAIILSSSGTTGLPKCVAISYLSLRALCCSMLSEKYFDMSPSTVSLVILPAFHIFGLFLMLYGVIGSSKSIILKKFKPNVFLETLEKHKVQKLCIVPTIAVFLAKSDSLDKYDLSNLNDIICGSAPLKHEVLSVIQERLKIKIRQVYGATEAGLVSLVNRLSKKNDTCGEIAPHILAKIEDIETRETLPPYKKGELCLAGPTITRAYVGNDKATKEAFDEDGYLRTGDVGYYDDEGDLFIVDRLKDIIKYKGFQISPAEIEDILLKNPLIKDAAVIGVPDERAGELPKAFVVTKDEITMSEQEVISFLSGYVSSYSYFQNGVHFIDAIPRTATGKILRQNLGEMFNKI